MRCEWTDNEGVCGVTHLAFSSLNQHLSEHMDRLLLTFHASSPRSSHRQAQNIREYDCPWSNCQYSTDTNNIVQLRLHIYFHGFHLSLQAAGRKCIRHKGLPHCLLENIDLDLVIPNITQPHHCEWNNGKCKQVFMFPADFYLHVWEHGTCAVSSESKELACRWDRCKYKTAKRSSLHTHLRTHTQEKMVACPGCCKLFSTNPGLEDHLHRQAPRSSLYACDLCRKQFATERLLKSHLNKHINNKQCSLCGFTLLDNSHLQRHMLFKHNDRRTQVCPICDKSFKTGAAADETAKVYKCHLCDKNFARCSYLGRHLSNYHKLKRKIYHKSPRNFKFVKQMDGFYKLADQTNSPLHSLARSLSYKCHVCQLKLPGGKYLSHHLMERHDFSLPKGYSRFRYHKNAEGFHELAMFRIESKTLHLDN